MIKQILIFRLSCNYGFLFFLAFKGLMGVNGCIMEIWPCKF